MNDSSLMLLNSHEGGCIRNLQLRGAAQLRVRAGREGGSCRRSARNATLALHGGGCHVQCACTEEGVPSQPGLGKAIRPRDRLLPHNRDASDSRSGPARL